MRKIVSGLLIGLCTISLHANDKNLGKKDSLIYWKQKGKFSLVFNQAAFNRNWQGGGSSNVAGNTTVNYELFHKNHGFTWENKFLADFGLTFIKGEDFVRKTNDRVELETRLGHRINNGNWNYSYFTNFKSQFAIGYRFDKSEESEEIIRTEETHFFSPATIQAGPGLLWKKNDNFNFNLAPVTARMIFVDDKFTSTPEYVDGSYFGVGTGKNSRFEFGGHLNAYFKFKVMEDITMENKLNLYSNYIEEPLNVDIDYTTNVNLTVNKYISGSLVFQAIYNDNASRGFQIREIIGIGLNYTL
ncbi:DUF3078 domain-containing protein [Aquimarina rhabdastrellae]